MLYHKLTNKNLVLSCFKIHFNRHSYPTEQTPATFKNFSIVLKRLFKNKLQFVHYVQTFIPFTAHDDYSMLAYRT